MAWKTYNMQSNFLAIYRKETGRNQVHLFEAIWIKINSIRNAKNLKHSMATMYSVLMMVSGQTNATDYISRIRINVLVLFEHGIRCTEGNQTIRESLIERKYIYKIILFDVLCMWNESQEWIFCFFFALHLIEQILVVDIELKLRVRIFWQNKKKTTRRPT